MSQYEIIYSDPPWPQLKGNVRKCRPNQGRELDYKTMSLPEIEDYHKVFLAEHSAPKHNVFMWAIDKYLFEAQELAEALGYKLHARLVWDKGIGIAPAFTLRFAHEYLLWFYLPGKILMPCKEMRGIFTTVMREQSTRHSAKPEAAYILLESLFPEAARVELFARKRREGWFSLGNELPVGGGLVGHAGQCFIFE